MSDSPYNSQSKKKKIRPGDRKQVLDLSKSSTASNHSFWRDTCDRQLNGPVMHDRQLKHVFQSEVSSEKKSVNITPYMSNRHSSSNMTIKNDFISAEHTHQSVEAAKSRDLTTCSVMPSIHFKKDKKEATQKTDTKSDKSKQTVSNSVIKVYDKDIAAKYKHLQG